MAPYKFFLTTFILLGIYCPAQTIQRQTTVSGGAVLTGTGGSLSQSIGLPAQAYLQSPGARLTQGFQQPEFDLRLMPVTGTFCNGDSITLVYELMGVFGTGTQLIAELSDAAGSFAVPIPIASAVTANGGSMTGSLPFNLTAGNGHSVRLRTSYPPRTGNITPIPQIDLCSVRLDIRALIEGLYIGDTSMTSALLSGELTADATEADSIVIELHSDETPFDTEASLSTIIHTDGTASCLFPSAIIGNTYYIVLRHRNSIATWSKNTVTFNEAVKDYIFRN